MHSNEMSVLGLKGLGEGVPRTGDVIVPSLQIQQRKQGGGGIAKLCC